MGCDLAIHILTAVAKHGWLQLKDISSFIDIAINKIMNEMADILQTTFSKTLKEKTTIPYTLTFVLEAQYPGICRFCDSSSCISQ